MAVVTELSEARKVSVFSRQNPQDISVLTINASWFCPVKCSYCHITKKASLDERDILHEEALAKELALAKKHGITEIRFSGGEPVALGDKLFEYAALVYDITGKKPVLLTSGIGINTRWMNKARGRFSGIYVSVENPLKPIQTVVDNQTILQMIRENVSDELPFRYGLTLVVAEHFKNIETIFDILYENVNKKFMPQLDYPCLKDFITPMSAQLTDVYHATKLLFAKYGLIPYYFVNLIGSPVFLSKDAFRLVLNLHPDGKYDIYDTMAEAWEYAYKFKTYALKVQNQSTTCGKCEWKATCKFHESGRVMYDWCDLRIAIFRGMYDGLGVDKFNNLNCNTLTRGESFMKFLKTDPMIQDAISRISTTTGMSTGTG
jgi:MoaA/NifB/PqqE/SkfB family radical SAM enzyme